MCARGVGEGPGAEEIRRPCRPWEARKQAREAPAGPVPIIKRSISTIVAVEGGGSPLERYGEGASMAGVQGAEQGKHSMVEIDYEGGFICTRN